MEARKCQASSKEALRRPQQTQELPSHLTTPLPSQGLGKSHQSPTHRIPRQNNLLNVSQSGFRANHSTKIALITATDDIRCLLNQGEKEPPSSSTSLQPSTLSTIAQPHHQTPPPRHPTQCSQLDSLLPLCERRGSIYILSPPNTRTSSAASPGAPPSAPPSSTFT